MDQDKLDALLTHIVDTFELSQKEQRQIIKFLRETLNITKEESKHAKEMCFKKGKEAKAAREAAANWAEKDAWKWLRLINKTT